MSPEDFKLPPNGQLPFSVPFSVAFNDDDFEPWTETSHFFSFYESPELVLVTPNEGKTDTVTPVIIKAGTENKRTFSMPSATVVEEQYDVLDDEEGNEAKEKTSIAYQPILCRFGRFGTTEAEYFNRTHIKCLTPHIADDSDIGYEEVDVEVAENGINFESGDNAKFTFIGPNAGKMLWIYILILLFIVLLLIILISLASQYWNRMLMQYQGINALEGERPQVVNRKLRYLIENMQEDEENH